MSTAPNRSRPRIPRVGSTAGRGVVGAPMPLDRGPVSMTPASVEAGSAVDRDLLALFGRMPLVFAVLSGPQHRLDTVNQAFLDTTGVSPDQLGAPIGVVLPQLADQGVLDLADEVYRTGQPITARETRFVLGSGESAREAFFDLSYEPQRGVDGTITGIRVLGLETSNLKHAQRLTGEHRALLEQVVTDAPLAQVLDGMIRVIEAQAPDVRASVLLTDDDGTHLRHGAGPSLPGFYNEAIDGIAIGEGVGSCGTAAHRHEPVIVTDIRTDPLWVDFRDLAGRAGLAACWSTPILDADGHLLGTFAIYSRRPRAPQLADLALNTVFARTAALAIERHRITQARDAAIARERLARQDLAYVLETSTRTAQELDHDAGLATVAAGAVPALAPLCAIDVQEGRRLRRVAFASVEHGIAWELFRGDEMTAQVLATGSSRNARLTADEVAAWSGIGVTHRMCVPLTARGRTFGVLTLLTIGDRSADGHTVALTEEIARRAALHADNARLYTERTQLAQDLQAELLPAKLPTIHGLDIATFYRPLGDGLRVGGDFYDVFPIGENRWAFAIGDVCGHGALAAATTGLVRNTARAVARLVPDPITVVEAINDALLERSPHRDAEFVTLLYGHLTVEPGRAALEFVRAGHLAPLLRRADGGIDELMVDGAALGLFTRPRLRSHQVVLAAGDSLVLVTDGLTEARSPSKEMFGEDRLRQALCSGAAGSSAAAILNAVVAAVDAHTARDSADDDQAALVLTCEPPA